MAILQEQVFRYLSDLIANGNHNDMLPSQNQLRERFNVSMITVRMALDKLEEEGLIFRRQGKGCFIRKVDNNEPDIRIFLVLPNKTDIRNEFVNGIFNAARERKYHVMFYSYNGNGVDLQREIRLFAPNAIIWVAPNLLEEAETIERLSELNAFLLLFNRKFSHPRVSYVTGDLFRDGKLMAENMLKRVPEKILYIGHDESISFSKTRYDGFVAGLENAGFDRAGGLCEIPFSTRIYRPGMLTPLILEALRRNRFEAVVCSQGAVWNDMAEALKKSRHGGKDVWFGNFNRIPEDDPLLSRSVMIVQPIEEMGRLAIDSVGRLIENDARQVCLEVPSRLILPPSILKKRKVHSLQEY